MSQIVTATIAVSDTVNETLSLGTATAANIQATTSRSFSYSNGTTGTAIDEHWEHTYTLASSATQTITLSALTDDIGRAVAFARVKRLIIDITAKTGNDFLTCGGAATHDWTAIVGATGDQFIVRRFDLKVADDATGFVVTSGSSDQLKFTNSGSASMTFAVSIIGDSV